MIIMRIGIVLCSVLCSMWSSEILAQAPLLEGTVEPVNVMADFGAGGANPPIQWTHQEERLGSSYLRLHFTEITDTSAVDYRLVVRDRNGRAVETVAKADVGGRSEFWTGIINGDFARVEVLASERPAGLRLKIAEIAFQKSMGAPFSISLPDDREPIIKYKNIPSIYSKARAVAKLTFVVGANTAMCTAFLIDNDRMLTNEHCINQHSTCETMTAIFGYQIGENGSVNDGEQHRCTRFIGSDRVLDVAMIQVAGKPGLVWGNLQLTARDIVKDEQAYMIQHPAGEPKQISRKDCSVVTAQADGNGAATDFGHKCDTLGGSSGSPVLGSDFAVIGLHHFGFDVRGDRWRDENRAVRMSRVIDWVNQQR
jgi:V8-like Glu-specific endopeptidase